MECISVTVEGLLASVAVEHRPPLCIFVCRPQQQLLFPDFSPSTSSARQHIYVRVLVSVLVRLGCRNKMPQARWLRQQEFTFYSTGDGKFKIKVPAGPVSREGSLLGFQTATSLLCLHMAFLGCAGGEKGSKLSGVSSYKGTNPSMRAPPSRPCLNLPKTPSPNTITLRLGLQYMNFGVTQFSL